MFILLVLGSFSVAGGGLAHAPSAVVCPLWGLILLILLVWGSFFGAGGSLALAPSVVVVWAHLGTEFVHFAFWGIVFGAGGSLALAPSVVLVWAPLGADFAHFACLGLVLGSSWGPRRVALFCGFCVNRPWYLRFRAFPLKRGWAPRGRTIPSYPGEGPRLCASQSFDWGATGHPFPGLGWHGPVPPRPALRWWAPSGADFVNFACFGFVFGAGGGLVLASSDLGPFGC